MNERHFGGERVTYLRRICGDDWLDGALQVVTLGIGWLIWFAIVAPKGKTPAKQLLHVYIHDYATGAIAGARQVWLREIVGKWLLIWVVSFIGLLLAHANLAANLGSLYWYVGAIWMFFDADRRALWDRLAGTVPRYYPNGRQPSTVTLAGLGAR